MARAAKACSHPTCPNTQPCEQHQRKAWTGSRRRERTVSGSRQQKRRRYVLQRDEYRCYLCGGFRLAAELVADHVINLAEGGEDSVENMRACCIDCHNEKVQREAQRARARTTA